MATVQPVNNLKQNRESRKIMELGLLAETAFQLLELPAHKNIFPLIGKTFKKICGKDIVVAVSEKNSDSESFRLKSLLGLGLFSTPIAKILGVRPSMLSCDFNESTKQYLTSGKLKKFKGGLKELSRGVISPKGISKISRLLDVNEIHIIGLVQHTKVLGAAVLISKKRPAGFSIPLVEAFAAKAAKAIERRQAELGLRKNLEKYKQLFVQSNCQLAAPIGDTTKKKGKETKARLREKQLIHADKMATFGVLMAGMTHEINNSNYLIMLNSELVGKIWKDAMPVLDRELQAEGEIFLGNLPYSRYRPEILTLTKGITEGALQIRKIVNSLKNYAHQDTSHMHGEIDMEKLIEFSIFIVSSLISKSTWNFSFKHGKLPAVRGHFQQLVQVIINLLTNACHALSDKKASISLTAEKSKDGRSIRISIRDQGKGISQNDLERIFDPFFTTKQDLGGAGLGLTVSRIIIQKHGGKLEFTSKLGKGTVVNLVLPVLKKYTIDSKS